MAELQLQNLPGTKAYLELDDNAGRDFVRMYYQGTECCRVDKDGFIETTSGWKYRHLVLHLGDIAANSDALVIPLLRPNVDITIEAVDIAVDTTVAGDAVNYQTLTLSDGTNSIATKTTVAGLTLGIPSSFSSLSATYKVLKPNDGDRLELTFTKTSSGKALSGLTITIAYSINQKAGVSATTGKTDFAICLVNGPETDAHFLVDDPTRDMISLKASGIEVLNVDVSGHMTTTAQDRDQVLVVNLGDIDVSEVDSMTPVLIQPAAEIRIRKVYVSADTTLAATDDTNYETIKLTDGTDTICQFTTGGPQATGIDITAGEWIDIGELNEVFAKIGSSDKLTVTFTKSGTGGVDLSGLTLQIEFSYEA